mgnify:CR=1 FL=1
MRKKRILTLSGILLGVLMCFNFNKVQAVDSVFSDRKLTRETLSTVAQANSLENAVNKTLTINAAKVSDDNNDNNIIGKRKSGNFYQWNISLKGNKVLSGHNVYEITEVGDSTYGEIYYCLQSDIGLGGQDGNILANDKDEYNIAYDMKTDKSLIKEKANSLNISKDDTTYNKILWVLDNSYMPTNSADYMNTDNYKNFMKKVGITVDDEQGLNLTEEDMKVVQQMAIWHFTNSANSTYNQNELPALYLNGKQLSSIYLYTTEYGEQITGRKREDKAKTLYKYFINNADGNYSGAFPILNLLGPSDLNPGVSQVKDSTTDKDSFIVGPYKLTGTNVDKLDPTIIFETNPSGGTLVDKNEKEINYLPNYINKEEFYIKVSKSLIQQDNTKFEIILTYQYNDRTLTFLTDETDPNNTQPVVNVKEGPIQKVLTKSVIFNITEVSVEKKWDDYDNQDGIRPATVKVQLLEDGKVKDTVELSNDKLTHTWNKLLADKTYTVVELDEKGQQINGSGKYNDAYSTTYENDGAKTIITNKHTPATVSRTVVKSWDDQNNQDGIRPTAVTVQLYANGIAKGEAVTLNEENGWTVTWSGLAEKQNGNPINYEIKEIKIGNTEVVENKAGGYTVSSRVSADKITTTITNTHIPEKISKTVTKLWDDENNQDGKRPREIYVTLYKEVNGEKTVVEGKENVKITPDKNDEWKCTWDDLPKYENGEPIVYTVEEKAIDGYTTGYSTDTDTFTIKNTHTPEKISKTVTKVWDDENNQDGNRPKEIFVTLYKEVNGEKTVVEGKENVKITPDKNDKWKCTWDDLPKYENGKPIVYTVEETAINGYTPAYSTDTFTITNKYVPGTVSRTVKKVWSDNNNQDGIRPTTVTVQLYADGVAKGEAVTLNKENSWTYTWTELPEKQNGTTINYEIKEIKIGNTEVVENKAGEYTVSSSVSEDKITTTITNTHTPATVGKTVKKVWDDKDNLARPTSVKVQLYANGTAKDSPVELNSENGWSYTWTNLNEKQDGKPIVYTAKEIPVNGYEASYSAESFENTDTIIITNKYTSIDFSLRKFITAVNDTELKSEDGKYLREPKVDQTVIGTKDASGNTITTAIYKHTKEPIAVQKGDTVTYTIRVYNEGETDGYVSKITDHLPEWLEFLPDDELNKKYLWTQDTNNNRTITTDIASKGKVTGEEIYSQRENKQMLSKYNKSGDLDFIDVQIKCKVKDTVVNEQLITNIADISGMQNKNGEDIEKDIDSAKDNVQLPTDAELPNYKGKATNKDDLTDKKYYYAGQEDDDDFEKLVVKNFDLSLRKFIIAVNNTELKSDIIDGSKYTREPEVDASKLGTKDANGNIITTATYTHPKTPVQVKKGDKVIYIIRVYNEGSLAGYATKIIENVPEGLTFVENSETNKKYNWKVEDGKLTTDYLADKIINPVSVVETTGNKNLDYKDIEVEFEVTAEPSKFAGKLITNWAEIGEDSNNDIDSTPGNDVKTEDDIDYEPLELTYFDLALRKFITNVNDTEYNNRVPEVDTSKLGTVDQITGEKITTATYTHTKDPVIVETGSTVIYTIRVYNEGTADGYANEITDDIPDGLEFLPEHEVNSGKDGYKWVMLDEEGKITQDVSKAKKITTNYLSENNDPTKVLSGYKEENGVKTLSYQDVKVAFKVIEPKNSKRIVINTAEISKASMEDIDSIPGNSKIEEDDIDNEYLRVETFDLALKKWVTETRVTYKGKTTTTKTGFTADSTEMAKVDIVASRLKSTTVKFVYNIQIINEGQVAGTATEIKDYVPSGLKFEEEDNEGWVYDKKDDSVTTTQLKDKVIEPGKSETVQIVLTWKNSTTNMGVKTNWAEISADNGDDVDSTPNNFDKLEDDIDDAKVILSIKTGSAKLYIALAVISIAILGGGTFAIKKYVIDK